MDMNRLASMPESMDMLLLDGDRGDRGDWLVNETDGIDEGREDNCGASVKP